MCSSSLRSALKHLVPRVRAVVVRQFLERVGLRGFEEGPELVFGDEMLGVRDVGLFEHAILVLADKVSPRCAAERSAPGLSSLSHAPCTRFKSASVIRRWPVTHS